ncbi:Protein of unknown function (DUF3632) domain containing protein [Elaphomyces granulatus]
MAASSENDAPDFSWINTRMVGTLPNLESNILDHLVLLLQCANEDNQIQSIRFTVDGITELYKRARPSNLSRESFPGKETYSASAFLSPTVSKDIPSPEECSEWLNLNSFTARLKREGLIHGTRFAMAQLRNALEEENTVREVANCNISVASQWIIRSGVELYREARDGGSLSDEPMMKLAGPLYNREPGLCPERWLFWKSRFSMVMNEVDEEVAKMTQQAVGEMERAEKVML